MLLINWGQIWDVLLKLSMKRCVNKLGSSFFLLHKKCVLHLSLMRLTVTHCSDLKRTALSLPLAAGWDAPAKQDLLSREPGSRALPGSRQRWKLHLSSVRRTVNGLLLLSLPRRDESGKQQAAIAGYGASSPGLSLPSDGKRW